MTDSLTQVTGAVSEPLDPDESEPLDPDDSAQRGDVSPSNRPPSDALAVYGNGDSVTETTEEERMCVHGVSESACGGGLEEE